MNERSDKAAAFEQESAYGLPASLKNRATLKLRELSQIRQLRGLLSLAGDWAIIFACAYAAQKSDLIITKAFAIFFIAGRQHALFVLMHEGTHYRLLKNRAWNDFVCEIFTAYPLFISMTAYRANHSAHHRYLNSDRDPDWSRKLGQEQWIFPTTPKVLVKRFSAYIKGLGFFEMYMMGRVLLGPPLPRLLHLIGASSLILLSGTWKMVLLYWIVPYFTLLPVFMKIRSIAEHFGLENKVPLNQSRTIKSQFWAAMAFAPHSVNYHLEHHLFPSVPHYNLEKFHSFLMQFPEYAQGAQLTRSYFGEEGSLYRELVAVRETEPAKKAA